MKYGQIILESMPVLAVLLVHAAGQDLVQLAAREKQRRQAGTPVRICIQHIPMEGAPSVAGPTSSSLGQDESKKRSSGPSERPAAARPADQSRRAFLFRRGPEVKERIMEERRQLEQMDRELADLVYRFPPIWRQGRSVENSKVVALRRTMERSRNNLGKWEQELRLLQEEVRRNDWPPGILRGQVP